MASVVRLRMKILQIKLLYFARLRESLDISQESLQLPEHVIDINSLLAFLAGRGEVWAAEFDGCKIIRAAINQTLVNNDALLNEGDEVAFFPPVTGG